MRRFVLFVSMHIIVMAAIPKASAAEPAKPPAVARQDDGAAGLQAQETEQRRLDNLRAALTGNDRSSRLAAWRVATDSDDPVARRLAMEAALDSRDPALGNLALRDWLSRRQNIPVLLYATKEDPGSVTVLQNLGPLTLKLESFAPASGEVVANMGAPGYDIARASTAVGALAQTTLTLNAYGCQLALQLTEHRTLDGLYRCKSLPALVARVVLD